jgi:hypothetical protein
MIEWVDAILKPYVANAPDHIVPLLILDSYRCHMMGSVVQRIQELGIEVRHIPGGCTSLCQPVDVGFNKPFKDRVRKQWLSWMIAEGIVHGTTTPPSRRDVAGWVDRAMAEMKREERIIQNAWRKTGYEWFPKEVAEISSPAAAAAVMNEGGVGESATTAAAEEEEIARVLNEYCARELFSEDIGMTTTDDNNEGDEDEGDEEERTRIADKQEVLPHYIA